MQMNFRDHHFLRRIHSKLALDGNLGFDGMTKSVIDSSSSKKILEQFNILKRVINHNSVSNEVEVRIYLIF